MSSHTGNRLQRIEGLTKVPDMTGRVALVTGASDGIGRVVARRLAEAGAVTLIAARDQTKGVRVRDEIRKATGNETVGVVELDLASLASVREAAATIRNRVDRLDLLVCCAGHQARAMRTETADGFETTFGVNHLGHALLARLLTDRLRSSAPSRILFLASEAHRRAKDGLDFDDLMLAKGRFRPTVAYNRSKLANILYTRELARHLEASGVDVNSVHPGAVDTAMVKVFFDRPVMRNLYPIARRAFISPEDAAVGVLRVALDPSLTHTTGQNFERGALTALGAVGRDDSAARRLWFVTEELIGLSGSDQ